MPVDGASLYDSLKGRYSKGGSSTRKRSSSSSRKRFKVRPKSASRKLTVRSR